MVRRLGRPPLAGACRCYRSPGNECLPYSSSSDAPCAPAPDVHSPEMPRPSPMPQRLKKKRWRRSPRTARRSDSPARSYAVMIAPCLCTRAVQHAHPEALHGHPRFRTVGAEAGGLLTRMKRSPDSRSSRYRARINARHTRPITVRPRNEPRSEIGCAVPRTPGIKGAQTRTRGHATPRRVGSTAHPLDSVLHYRGTVLSAVSNRKLRGPSFRPK